MLKKGSLIIFIVTFAFCKKNQQEVSKAWREIVRITTASKVSIFRVFLVRIFPHSSWIRRDTEYLFVFSPNTGKYRREKFWIHGILYNTYNTSISFASVFPFISVLSTILQWMHLKHIETLVWNGWIEEVLSRKREIIAHFKIILNVTTELYQHVSTSPSSCKGTKHPSKYGMYNPEKNVRIRSFLRSVFAGIRTIYLLMLF